MISAELCYRDYIDNENFENAFVNLNFFGNSEAKTLLKELVDLIKFRESILKEIKIECLISRMKTNNQKMKDLQRQITTLRRENVFLELPTDIQDICRRITKLQRLENRIKTNNDEIRKTEYREDISLLRGLRSKIDNLIQQNDIIKKEIIKLQDSQLYNPYKLKYEYIEIINELGFNLIRIKRRDTNNVDEQVYEYNGSNENMIRRTCEKIKEYKKAIQHEIESSKSSYTNKDHFDHRRFESNIYLGL